MRQPRPHLSFEVLREPIAVLSILSSMYSSTNNAINLIPLLGLLISDVICIVGLCVQTCPLCRRMSELFWRRGSGGPAVLDLGIACLLASATRLSRALHALPCSQDRVGCRCVAAVVWPTAADRCLLVTTGSWSVANYWKHTPMLTLWIWDALC